MVDFITVSVNEKPVASALVFWVGGAEVVGDGGACACKAEVEVDKSDRGAGAGISKAFVAHSQFGGNWPF